MIVRPASGSVHLITQPDHAALARRIMEHWTPLAHLERRDTILYAIGEHDNGWREPDAAPMIDPRGGRLADFINAPLDVKQAVWPRGVDRLAHNPWAAALVAEHSLFVFERFRGHADWAAFFAEMEASREQLVRAAGLTLPDLLREYVFIRLGDLISLTYCNAWTEPQEYDAYVVSCRESQIAVSPDLFDQPNIPFTITARELPDRRFTSDAELREAYRHAPTVTLTGKVSALP